MTDFAKAGKTHKGFSDFTKDFKLPLIGNLVAKMDGAMLHSGLSAGEVTISRERQGSSCMTNRQTFRITICNFNIF